MSPTVQVMTRFSPEDIAQMEAGGRTRQEFIYMAVKEALRKQKEQMDPVVKANLTEYAEGMGLSLQDLVDEIAAAWLAYGSAHYQETERWPELLPVGVRHDDKLLSGSKRLEWMTRYFRMQIQRELKPQRDLHDQVMRELDVATAADQARANAQEHIAKIEANQAKLKQGIAIGLFPADQRPLKPSQLQVVDDVLSGAITMEEGKRRLEKNKTGREK